MKRRRYLLVVLLGVVALKGLGARPAREGMPVGPWRRLEPGLELGTFTSPQPSEFGDSRIRVLRIDPTRYQLRLLNASAPGQGATRTAREWCREHGLSAAINASMYREDSRTSVSLMRTREHTNNPRLTKDMAVLAFDRLDRGVPEVQILDRECDDYEILSKRYGTLVQSIRMVSCKGRNVWSQQPRKWSTAALGTDAEGRVLFIHVRSPFSTHDLIEALLGLPIGLKRAMYVEGGPEAQLYVAAGGEELEVVGSYEIGLLQDDDNSRAWHVPNVIGIAKR